MKRPVKLDDLDWREHAFCQEGTHTTQEWVCVQYPDLRTRVHQRKKGGNQFHQVFVGKRKFANVKQAYVALVNQRARRISGKNKTKPG